MIFFISEHYGSYKRGGPLRLTHNGSAGNHKIILDFVVPIGPLFWAIILSEYQLKLFL